MASAATALDFVLEDSTSNLRPWSTTNKPQGI